jgi:hypothetical protein
MIARVSELLISVLCLLLLFYGSVKRWRGIWLVVLGVPVIVVWGWIDRPS